MLGVFTSPNLPIIRLATASTSDRVNPIVMSPARLHEYNNGIVDGIQAASTFTGETRGD